MHKIEVELFENSKHYVSLNPGITLGFLKLIYSSDVRTKDTLHYLRKIEDQPSDNNDKGTTISVDLQVIPAGDYSIITKADCSTSQLTQVSSSSSISENETSSGNISNSIVYSDSAHSGFQSPVTPDSKREKFTCDFCHLPFVSQSKFLRHRRIHTESDPFLCVHCGDSFTRHQDLRKHRNELHLQNKSYKCSCCPKTFATRVELDGHQWRHTGEKQHSCHICSRSYSTKGNLKHHVNTHAGMAVQECSFCPLTFMSHSALECHMAKHTGVKPYKCRFCDSCFGSGGQLTAHERIHTGEKPYSCSVCSKTFRLRSTQINHERRHSNSRPFKCHLCQRAFTQIVNLHQHLKTHENRQSRCLVCPICLKEIFSGRNMQKHLSRHNEIKLANRTADVQQDKPDSTNDDGSTSYKCFACAKQWATVNALTKHIEKKHCRKLESQAKSLANNYKQLQLCICSFCTQTFTSYDILRAHIQTIHPSEAWRMGLIELNSNRPLSPTKAEDLNVLESSVVTSAKKTDSRNGRSLFRCWFCPKILSSPGAAVQHMTQEHDNLDSLSSTIEAVNKLDEKLTSFAKTVQSATQNDTQFTCSYCKTVLNGQEAFEIHLLGHQATCTQAPISTARSKFIPILPKPHVHHSKYSFSPLKPTLSPFNTTQCSTQPTDFLVELNKICQSLQVSPSAVSNQSDESSKGCVCERQQQGTAINSARSSQTGNAKASAANVSLVESAANIETQKSNLSALSSPFLSALQELSSNIYQIVHKENPCSDIKLNN